MVMNATRLTVITSQDIQIWNHHAVHLEIWRASEEGGRPLASLAGVLGTCEVC